jgi:hypothetical protein
MRGLSQSVNDTSKGFVMNKLLLAMLVSLAAGHASAQQGDSALRHQDGANASSTQGPGYATYRRVVLGDTSVVIPASEKPAGVQEALVPGSYARYLIHNGMSRAEALARAQGLGETPSPASNEAPRRLANLSSYERYQRTVLGTSDAALESHREWLDRNVTGVSTAKR